MPSPPFAPVVSVQFSTACFAFCSLLLLPFKLLHGLLRSAVPPKTLPAVRSLSGAQGQQQLHSEFCIEVPVNSCCAHSSQPCSRGTQGLPEPSFGRWVQLSPLQCTENAPSCHYKAAVGPDPTSLQGASNKAELQSLKWPLLLHPRAELILQRLRKHPEGQHQAAGNLNSQTIPLFLLPATPESAAGVLGGQSCARSLP